MKTILTYGTFDLLHYGHINLLRRAKNLGDYLIVGLSTDTFNHQKGKKSYFRYDERKILLESIRYVDSVIPESNWEQKIWDIENFMVDTLVMGDDWEGRFDYLSSYCKVKYLSRTPTVSTKKIKRDLKKVLT
ncbi:glycerol-3-phosphate cytidylyltransferase [Lentibacillus cibarius]|uniref:Glycerol-3-phosphate cytidylyltransferase n=1 Tax=Lentibacillus cibarius TaxID=2583219 RepID=A0A549YEH3_9BACI|nr:glycerol-3-phosphate cytidylyltransferase [Lentibacillus cibarius]TMN21417.1 glycerol-3-phosphate cytidylyltransferase [Lentibacillus cibarius]TRM10293.1 glycerol-3-phosphate cytidylyltransferase [Lentibacillus cibarius]